MTDVLIKRELLERLLYVMDNYVTHETPEEDQLRAILAAPRQPEGDELTAQRLRALLTYDSDTGIFKWDVNLNGAAKRGSIAGTIDTNGYVSIKIDKKFYRAHRLAWLYVYGVWPEKYIDHINHVTTDNRIANLRECDNSQNQCNQRVQKRSKSGTKGVTWHKATGKWQVQCKLNGKNYHGGTFESLEEAVRVCADLRKSIHEEFACER